MDQRVNLDPQAIRVLGRVAERAATINRHPHRYEVDPEVLNHIVATAEQLERLFTRVETIKIGSRTMRVPEPSHR